MPYQWPLDPQELFVERYPADGQHRRAGAGRGRDALRDHGHVGRRTGRVGVRVVTAGSALRRGGQRGARDAGIWLGEVSRPRRRRQARGPRHQVEHYLLAAEDFPVDFERRFLELPYHGSSTRLPSTSSPHRASPPTPPS